MRRLSSRRSLRRTLFSRTRSSGPSTTCSAAPRRAATRPEREAAPPLATAPAGRPPLPLATATAAARATRRSTARTATLLARFSAIWRERCLVARRAGCASSTISRHLTNTSSPRSSPREIRSSWPRSSSRRVSSRSVSESASIRSTRSFLVPKQRPRAGPGARLRRRGRRSMAVAAAAETCHLRWSARSGEKFVRSRLKLRMLSGCLQRRKSASDASWLAKNSSAGAQLAALRRAPGLVRRLRVRAIRHRGAADCPPWRRSCSA
mmetsp:Transcript_46995/g.102078  ORF Transcript_46995/g.102078 Transcript_46995/m.102078 type:complete len:265 (+) Transcript_46995:187-981(+)